MSAPITIPDDPVKWALENPEELKRALTLLNALLRLEVAVKKNGITTKSPVQVSTTNAIVTIEV